MIGLTDAEMVTYKRKIKTREELREIIGPRPGKRRSSCATARSTWCTPGTSGT